MHELSIMESVLNMVEESIKQSNISKVNKIKLVIGKLSMVLPDSLQFCFQSLSHDELFKDAILEIEQKGIIVRCTKCEQQFVPIDFCCYICPECGAKEMEIIQGRELYLDYYEGE